MRIDHLVKIKILKINSKTIIFNKRIRSYCLYPYPGHKRGCPNYGKNPFCPPTAPYREDIIKKYNNFILIYAIFDFHNYLIEMELLNPGRTHKQYACVLYWQSALKKLMKDKIKGMTYDELFGAGSGFLNSQSMESAGIDVFRMFHLNKIDYEIRPKEKIIMAALLCRKKEKKGLDKFIQGSIKGE